MDVSSDVANVHIETHLSRSFPSPVGKFFAAFQIVYYENIILQTGLNGKQVGIEWSVAINEESYVDELFEDLSQT